MNNKITIIMTDRERFALYFLSNKMEATAKMVGDHIIEECNKMQWWGGESAAHVGGLVLRNMDKKGLVMRIPELNAWRLTREGRDLVSKSREKK